LHAGDFAAAAWSWELFPELIDPIRVSIWLIEVVSPPTAFAYAPVLAVGIAAARRDACWSWPAALSNAATSARAICEPFVTDGVPAARIAVSAWRVELSSLATNCR
jgi:hypothetical protein